MKVLILDFFNILKRYTYAYDITKYSEGELIDKLTFNILNRICDTVNILKPDVVFICSDSGRNKRAIALSSGTYKANRKRSKSMTDEEKEKSYVEYIKNMMLTLPFPFIDIKDTEADMIIYCLTDYIKKLDSKIHITIASSDSDFIQLLDKNVNIYDWYKNDININNWYVKYKKFDEKYFNSKNYALAKSIIGDSSDNIKGVQNFGWGKVSKLFDIIYNYYEDVLVPENIEVLIDMITELINNKDIELDKKDLKFLINCQQTFTDSKKIIKTNQSMIDLSMIETPYIYNIQNAIKRSIKNNVKFNRKEFIKMLKLERYKDNVDNIEYQKILNKNSKSSLVFMQLEKRINAGLLQLRQKDYCL